MLCEELTPNLDSIYIHSSVFVIGDWAGDSKGIAWRTYMCELMKTKNDRNYIFPLKSWCGYPKEDTFVHIISGILHKGTVQRVPLNIRNPANA